MFRFIRNLFSPAGDTTTPEQEARIAAARALNSDDFAEGSRIADRLGLNAGERDQAVRAYRQLRAKGLWTGDLESYIQHRIDTMHVGQ